MDHSESNAIRLMHADHSAARPDPPLIWSPEQSQGKRIYFVATAATIGW